MHIYVCVCSMWVTLGASLEHWAEWFAVTTTTKTINFAVRDYIVQCAMNNLLGVLWTERHFFGLYSSTGSTEEEYTLYLWDIIVCICIYNCIYRLQRSHIVWDEMWKFGLAKVQGVGRMDMSMYLWSYSAKLISDSFWQLSELFCIIS